ncbi:MAG: HAD family hydrolase [Candidatus Omnitrophota bacterium]
MNSKRLFIFDVDGTLADSYRAIAESLNYVRNKLGYAQVSFAKIKKSIGKGDKLFIRSFFSKGDQKEALRLYRIHHKKSLGLLSKTRPFAKWVLSHLVRRKKIIAVASNRPKEFTVILLKSLGIYRYFNYILCADEIGRLKPDPAIILNLIRLSKVEREQAVYIGDMDIDLETARRAGVEAVFIKGGSSPVSCLRAYKKKKVISSLKEILKLYG